ncbi:MAG: hypothetical protein K1X79_08085 [Oligoflexia bacterium]|nr:hypothetical protein [Oligoflexia bacterium]
MSNDNNPKRPSKINGPESGDFATSFAKLAELAAQDLAASSVSQQEEKQPSIIVGKKRPSEPTSKLKQVLDQAPVFQVGAALCLAALFCLGYLAYPNLKSISEIQHRADLVPVDDPASDAPAPEENTYTALDALADVASARPLSDKSFMDIKTDVTLEKITESLVSTATDLAGGLRDNGLSWETDVSQLNDQPTVEPNSEFMLSLNTEEPLMCQ